MIFYNDDKVETLSLHKGSYVLMAFWATWCPYCKQQLPAFSLLKERYKNNEKIKFIALSTDEEGYGVVERFLRQNKLDNLGVYHDKEKNLFRALGLRGIPTILLFSKDGTIIKAYNGMRQLDIDYLDELLDEEENKINN